MNMLKKNQAYSWIEKCQRTFEELKKTITKEPVFCLSNHTKLFEVYMDTSSHAIGGVLMQDGHPIGFKHRKLNDVEHHYTIQEKKMTVVHYLRT